ncbi:Hcp family type VI secretion system effector [Aquisphaera insulae]|uniref:Hcp family type VI secretion system effector n=1 Tax=Aquisphaera insulae TaxID=2712864 RepID=UPI0013EB2DE8|nr:type VI secretion system tube protein Hcp [Aquisphaera insulae]
MAFDTYLKIDSVDGESQQSNHEKWIEIYSFSWGASNPTTVGPGSGGLSAGRVSVSSFNVMKKTEASSATLFAACATGKHFKDATVEMSKATGDGGQKVFLKYVFSDVLIESIQWSGSTGGDDSPTESLSIAFAKVAINYFKQDETTGAMAPAGDATWDLTKVAK